MMKVLMTVTIADSRGGQSVTLPFVDELRKHFNAEFTVSVSPRFWDDPAHKDYLARYRVRAVTKPSPLLIVAKCNFIFEILYRLYRLLHSHRKIELEQRENAYAEILNVAREHDVFIDTGGIQFHAVKFGWLRKYQEYVDTVFPQWLAQRYGKLYLKYTKSYGPVQGLIYKLMVKRNLKNLPFIMVRGQHNLEEVRKLKTGRPLYSFPDRSLVLEPESREWALDYLQKLGVDVQGEIVGLSPSAVIANIKEKGGSACGDSHLCLCERVLDLYRQKEQHVVILPHSVRDGINEKGCDLAVARRLHNALDDKQNVFLIEDMNLTYKQLRAIIGLMDFYVAARYHAIASALFMGVPVVSLSWHIKYQDIMTLFLDEPPVVDCEKTTVDNAMSLIEKYYSHRDWFDAAKVAQRKASVSGEVNKSTELIVHEIDKFLTGRGKT
jgi:polysaccharide pyruvyl transferase WcaK-like protein